MRCSVFSIKNGVLTILVVAQHGMIFGGAAAADVDEVTWQIHVLLFRYFEADGEIKQAHQRFQETHWRT